MGGQLGLSWSTSGGTTALWGSSVPPRKAWTSRRWREHTAVPAGPRCCSGTALLQVQEQGPSPRPLHHGLDTSNCTEPVLHMTRSAEL